MQSWEAGIKLNERPYLDLSRVTSSITPVYDNCLVTIRLCVWWSESV